MTDASATRDNFLAFERIRAEHGLRDALAYLVHLTPYRFVGLFRFQDGRAAAAVHYDRQQPDQLHSAEVPDTATYCCFVRDGGGSFTTADALADPRAEGHPAREAVRAYCGVPVMDPEGQVLATLCHYDTEPRDPAQLDFELVLQVAAALAQARAVPPYPTPAAH